MDQVKKTIRPLRESLIDIELEHAEGIMNDPSVVDSVKRVCEKLEKNYCEGRSIAENYI
jgi:hypothetical protein